MSIVSGTYNRLSLLKRMVKSARKSAGDLSYEIILVDGGSDDGTIEWCREQDNVVLIEQGELLGAVKAFNAGCKAARGRYVAILNDDIEVQGDTIHHAHEYLEGHPDVASVAFRNVNASGRYNKHRRPYLRYHGYLYGQCCMVRRGLGDYAGWWGEGYHTYGGDTRLSMRLWELGFKTMPVAGCSILDHIARDELREKRQEAGNNPDGQLFKSRWMERLPSFSEWIPGSTRRLGAKARKGRLRSLRFRTAMYKEVDSLRMSQLRSLQRCGPAQHVNQTRLIKMVGRSAFQNRASKIVREFKPDLVILQEQGGGYLSSETISKMREDNPNTAFVNFNGDVRRWNENHFGIARVVGLQCLVSPDFFPLFASRGATNLAWWLNACEDEFLEVERKRPRRDIAFLGNRCEARRFPGTELRTEAVEALVASGLDFDLRGKNWGYLDPNVERTPDNAAYNARIYANSKLAVSISARDDLWGYTSDRLFFAVGSGCPTLVKRFRGMEAMGFVDGDTCIVWDTVAELLDKADYYLQHAEEREAIGKRGRELVQRRHDFDARTDALLTFLDTKGVYCG